MREQVGKVTVGSPLKTSLTGLDKESREHNLTVVKALLSGDMPVKTDDEESVG